MSHSGCSVIIVTHNSEQFLAKVLHALEEQTTQPAQVLLVDSGSQNLSYLYEARTTLPIKVIEVGRNVGFCAANNIGMENLHPSSDTVFFLNPDAFPFSDFIEKATSYIREHSDCAAITGKTFGYDILADKPSGVYDTTGIFQTWYGKWYDRAQGRQIGGSEYNIPSRVPAICGAVFFARRAAIEQVLINRREVFDESFYMYKEDVDLSLRLRKSGWKLIYHPNLCAYHCRGWSQNRRDMSRQVRLCSAKNELRLQWREKKMCGLCYSFAKYTAVKCLDL